MMKNEFRIPNSEFRIKIFSALEITPHLNKTVCTAQSSNMCAG